MVLPIEKFLCPQKQMKKKVINTNFRRQWESLDNSVWVRTEESVLNCYIALVENYRLGTCWKSTSEGHATQPIFCRTNLRTVEMVKAGTKIHRNCLEILSTRCELFQFPLGFFHSAHIFGWNVMPFYICCKGKKSAPCKLQNRGLHSKGVI